MSGQPEDDYRAINTEATIALARAAERAGVKRFVFLSSIRAQIGTGLRDRADRGPDARPDRCLWPLEARGRTGARQLGIDWVALRPVLVYGPGVKGNMAALLDLARSPCPLPLGAPEGAALAPVARQPGGGGRRRC